MKLPLRPVPLGYGTRLREWLVRYGPAECGGLVVAFVASVVARRFVGSTGGAVAAAYAAAWGETIGYAGVLIVRDFATHTRSARRDNRSLGARDAGLVASGLLAEFGPAGVIDTLITRPFMMALGLRLFGPALGVVVGKVAADVLFYVPVIYMFERRKARQGYPSASQGDDRR